MTTLPALSGTFTLDPTLTEVGFTVRHSMVSKVRGTFTDVEGHASTEEGLRNPHIDVTVQVASISTGQPDRDLHLANSEFFHVDRFPTITFVSSDVDALDEETLRVTGDLTIRDVTQPITIDFTYEGDSIDPDGRQRVSLTGATSVNRSSFGLTWNATLETGGVLVSERVDLSFVVSAVRDNA